MATVITQEELIEALRVAQSSPKEARTVKELAALWSLDVVKVRDAIGKLAMQDRIETHQVKRKDIAGRDASVPAYTIKPAPKRTKP